MDVQSITKPGLTFLNDGTHSTFVGDLLQISSGSK